MALFGRRLGPFGGGQFTGGPQPMQSAQMAMAPEQIVAQALMGPLSGANQGGVRTADDARAIAARGAADATLSNIGQAFNTGMGLMGGMGALKSVAKMGLSHLGIGEDPFRDLAGFAKPSQSQLGSIQQGNPQQMQNEARRMADRAHADAKSREAAAKESRAEAGRVARGV